MNTRPCKAFLEAEGPTDERDSQTVLCEYFEALLLAGDEQSIICAAVMTGQLVDCTVKTCKIAPSSDKHGAQRAVACLKQLAGRNVEAGRLISTYLPDLLHSIRRTDHQHCAPTVGRQILELIAVLAKSGRVDRSSCVQFLLSASIERECFDKATAAKAIALVGTLVATKPTVEPTVSCMVISSVLCALDMHWLQATKTLKLAWLSTLAETVEHLHASDAIETEATLGKLARRLGSMIVEQPFDANMLLAFSSILLHMPTQCSSLALPEIIVVLDPDAIVSLAHRGQEIETAYAKVLAHSLGCMSQSELSSADAGWAHIVKLSRSDPAAAINEPTKLRVSFPLPKRMLPILIVPMHSCKISGSVTRIWSQQVLQQISALSASVRVRLQEIVVKKPLAMFEAHVVPLLADPKASSDEICSAAQSLELLARLARTGTRTGIFSSDKGSASEAACACCRRATVQTLVYFIHWVAESQSRALIGPARFVCNIVAYVSAWYREEIRKLLRPSSRTVERLLQLGMHEEVLDLIFTQRDRRLHTIKLVVAASTALTCYTSNEEGIRNLTQAVALIGSASQRIAAHARETMAKCLAVGEREGNGYGEDTYDYMVNAEQRADDDLLLDDAATTTVTAGVLARHFQMVIGACEIHHSKSGVLCQLRVAAIVSAGKVLVNSRELASRHASRMVNLLFSGSAQARLAALAVVCDLLQIIPTHVALVKADRISCLSEVLGDPVLGRAAVQELIRLCSARILAADVHLAGLTGCLGRSNCESDDVRILSFFATFKPNAALIFRTFCQASHDGVPNFQQGILKLAREFIVKAPDLDEFASLLIKRLQDRVDVPTGAILSSIQGTNSTATKLSELILRRNIAALCRHSSTVLSAKKECTQVLNHLQLALNNVPLANGESVQLALHGISHAVQRLQQEEGTAKEVDAVGTVSSEVPKTTLRQWRSQKRNRSVQQQSPMPAQDLPDNHESRPSPMRATNVNMKVSPALLEEEAASDQEDDTTDDEADAALAKRARLEYFLVQAVEASTCAQHPD